MRSTLVSMLVGVALLSAAAVCSFRLAAAHLDKPYDISHVPTSSAARLASLGHRTLVSDLYWLSAVQYIGDPQAEVRGWSKLYPSIDLVTDLDPRHGYAYQTAGIVLSAAGLLDESDAILMKGMEKGPSYWTFPYYLAFNAWFYRGDYAEGARYAEMAARLPGASANVSHLAVSLESKAGRPEDAIEMLLELQKTVKDDVTAQRLAEQLKLALLEHDAQMLERAVARFQVERNRPISSLRDLVSAGLVAAIPEDPFGGTYVWGADGKVRSSKNPFRFELRERPHAPRFRYRPKGAPQSGVLR